MKQNKMQFVDIHTHILPGVDDGAANMEQALELLRMSREDGIGAVVLSPLPGSAPAVSSDGAVSGQRGGLCAGCDRKIGGWYGFNAE